MQGTFFNNFSVRDFMSEIIEQERCFIVEATVNFKGVEFGDLLLFGRVGDEPLVDGSVVYGELPNGWEGLLRVMEILNKNEFLFGMIGSKLVYEQSEVTIHGVWTHFSKSHIFVSESEVQS